MLGIRPAGVASIRAPDRSTSVPLWPALPTLTAFYREQQDNRTAGRSLHLADDLAGLCERFHHLLALLSPADREVALLEELVQRVGLVHVL